jgi:rhodanese-related sulfurtransferase
MKLVIILLASLLTWAKPALAEISEISPQQLQNPGQEIVVIDVRTRGEYDSGHIPGALHVPWDSIVGKPEQLEAYRGKTIVTYCAVGVRAMRALEALQQAGYPKLGHLAGDIPAWSQAGLPLE